MYLNKVKEVGHKARIVAWNCRRVLAIRCGNVPTNAAQDKTDAAAV